jgi:hypothetical protein
MVLPTSMREQGRRGVFRQRAAPWAMHARAWAICLRACGATLATAAIRCLAPEYEVAPWHMRCLRAKHMQGDIGLRREQDDVVERLRDPNEPLALALCIFGNVVIVMLAVFVVLAGTEWLVDHPRLGDRVGTFRAIAIAAILAFPATMIGRRSNVPLAHGNAFRVSERQFPALHEELLRACAKLGLDEIPDLYVGRVEGALATVFSAHGRRHCIVLDGDKLFDKHWKRGMDWISFILAREVAAIRLGHTHWWVELVTSYAGRVPGVRSPLLIAWARSQDRCAAYVVPEGVRGLVVEVTGKDLIWDFDVIGFVTQPVPSGFWAWLATVRRRRPSIVARAQALYQAGLFDLERDRARQRASRDMIVDY